MVSVEWVALMLVLAYAFAIRNALRAYREPWPVLPAKAEAVHDHASDICDRCDGAG